jgi:hypothetical protein
MKSRAAAAALSPASPRQRINTHGDVVNEARLNRLGEFIVVPGQARDGSLDLTLSSDAQQYDRTESQRDRTAPLT